MSDPDTLLSTLSKRYGQLDPSELEAVLVPLLVPIKSIDPTVEKVGALWRATFTIDLTEENSSFIVVGRTGKFVPGSYVDGTTVWRELAKGRIIAVDYGEMTAAGEIYVGGTKTKLATALELLKTADYWEVDRFGAAAKVLSALVEQSLMRIGKEQGYVVRRMTEDMAKHLGEYAHYDFEFLKGGEMRRVEVKSLWGTNTDLARLIRSKGKDNPTSSCRFDTQDIFAVNRFLRTGNLHDFAFARSISALEAKPPHGLPVATGYPTHVHQNPPISDPPAPPWFASIDEVWD